MCGVHVCRTVSVWCTCLSDSKCVVYLSDSKCVVFGGCFFLGKRWQVNVD